MSETVSPRLKLIHVWDGSFVSSDGAITIRPISDMPGKRWQVEYIDRTITARCRLHTNKRTAFQDARSIHDNGAALRFAKRKV